jgi:lipopolysaccharide transport system ATP-binding protein
MSAIITVEGVSKKFIIGHEEKERYSTLRDTMTRRIKGMLNFDRKERTIYTTEEFWALNDINFNINQGDRIGIIGRNGAGKSTLLKILSRITEPTKGKITIHGRVASLLEVGTGFHPELTGRENIFLNGAILGMSRAEIRSKFDEIVAFAEIESFLDTPVKRYSSGMYVRLAFAVAAYLEPEILIVDEVLAVGDAQFQKKCLGKMEDVSRNDGRTVLFVSHDLSSVSKLCSTAVFLNKGQIAATGHVDDVIQQYLVQSRKGDQHFVRIGTREIEVKDMIFRNADGAEIESLTFNEAVSIEIICDSKRPMSNIEFAVGFNNLHNTRVTSLWSAFKGQSFEINQSTFKVVFQIPSLRLIPGDYQVVTHIIWGQTTIERIDNFKGIHVKYPHYETGKAIPTIGQGYYVEKFDVQVEQ